MKLYTALVIDKQTDFNGKRVSYRVTQEAQNKKEFTQQIKKDYSDFKILSIEKETIYNAGVKKIGG